MTQVTFKMVFLHSRMNINWSCQNIFYTVNWIGRSDNEREIIPKSAPNIRIKQHYATFSPSSFDRQFWKRCYVKTAVLVTQHMKCNLVNSYLLFNSNKSSFVSVCSFLLSIAVPNNYMPVWDNLNVAPSLSLFFHQHLLYSICFTVNKLVEAIDSSHSLRSGSGVQSGAGPPSANEPNLLW